MWWVTTQHIGWIMGIETMLLVIVKLIPFIKETCCFPQFVGCYFLVAFQCFDECYDINTLLVHHGFSMPVDLISTVLKHGD